MNVNAIEITVACIIGLVSFTAGLFTGGRMAIGWVKFGIHASYECRHGDKGLVSSESADAEFEMMDEMDKESKGAQV